MVIKALYKVKLVLMVRHCFKLVQM